MSWKSRGLESTSKNVVSRKLTFLLCIGCFCAGMLFTDRMWAVPEAKDISRSRGTEDEKLQLVSDGCGPKLKGVKGEAKEILGEVSKTPDAIQTLDKTISNLEMELAAARAVQDSLLSGSPISEDLKLPELTKKRKYLMVVGINTAFSSRKRRDSVRATWMPQVQHQVAFLIELLKQKIGNTEIFLRLEHVEGYLELSAKTKTYFTTAVQLWDADFYVKVDDDVHVNIATLGATLARHRSKPRVYIGCMKSGPVLAQKHVLHKYANEDVSLGSWFIGLDVEHIDDRRLCCGTPPDKYDTRGTFQIASGRPRLATYVLLHLTGAAVEFAILLIGLKRCTADVEKEKTFYGILLSDELKFLVITGATANKGENAPTVQFSYTATIMSSLRTMLRGPLGLCLFYIICCLASTSVAVTNHQHNPLYAQLHFNNLIGLEYMVGISAVSAAYAVFAAVSSWLGCLLTKPWLFFVIDQVLAYLMVTSMAAQGEFLYLAYKGDQVISWSEACFSYGKFCNRVKLALALHVVAAFCFLILAVISGCRVFRRYEPPFPPSKEAREQETT
ncbi:UNVERIFIED_CONTAM: putative beta-1,3-galactosyltransferase 4 [Sesamum radiatum]|uniref:Beta-1,3-galactosyltransferase 4 n=1 Tax=Sesamum radiatum TaxID=300843 RepID=A0AAW2T3P9_SESRA